MNLEQVISNNLNIVNRPGKPFQGKVLENKAINVKKQPISGHQTNGHGTTITDIKEMEEDIKDVISNGAPPPDPETQAAIDASKDEIEQRPV